MKIFQSKSLTLVIIILSVALSACESKQPSKELAIADYGCLPELEAHDSTDKSLLESGVLKSFLRANPKYHVSTLKDISDDPNIFRWCLHNQAEQEFQRKFKEDYFRPIVTADTNQDGNLDLIVVLVNEAKFSVVVFNGYKNEEISRPYWLIDDSTGIILGLEIRDQFIMPMYCTGCDSNPLFLWVGDDYDLDGHIKNDSVCVKDQSHAYVQPDASSDVVWSADSDQLVVITDIGPKNNNEYRWYQISIKDDPTAIGYVQSTSFLEGPSVCE